MGVGLRIEKIFCSDDILLFSAWSSVPILCLVLLLYLWHFLSLTSISFPYSFVFTLFLSNEEHILYPFSRLSFSLMLFFLHLHHPDQKKFEERRAWKKEEKKERMKKVIMIVSDFFAIFVSLDLYPPQDVYCFSFHLFSSSCYVRLRSNKE